MRSKLTFDELMVTHKARKPKDEEHRIQCACVRWFRLQYPQLNGRLFAVPNGGRRDATTAAKLKAEGVIAGVSVMPDEYAYLRKIHFDMINDDDAVNWSKMKNSSIKKMIMDYNKK